MSYLETIAQKVNVVRDVQGDRGKKSAALKELNQTFDKALKEVSGDNDRVVRELSSRIVMCTTTSFSTDNAESIRTAAVELTTKCIRHLDGHYITDILDKIEIRMCFPESRESSEDVRLLLIQLCTDICKVFGEDSSIYSNACLDKLGRILKHGLADNMIEAKLESAKCILSMCGSLLSKVKFIAVPLIKEVKGQMRHHQAKVRVAMVEAFNELILCGAQEILEDSRDFPAEQSTMYQLAGMIDDRNWKVRVTLLKSFRQWLTILPERLDHHHRLMPLVLLCTTDDEEEIRKEAVDLLNHLGELYRKDNEDNSIVSNIETRRVNFKDIEWYADEHYPDDRNLTCKSAFKRQPLRIEYRPSVTTRMVVQDCVRRWLPDILKQMCDTDWAIKNGNTTWRMVAIRIFQATVVYIEECVVQYLQQILEVLYKTIFDDKKEFSSEVIYATQLLGLFLLPCHYCPLIFAKRQPAPSDCVEVKVGDKMLQVPNWFSASSPTIRAQIIVAFMNLVQGAAGTISPQQVSEILTALAADVAVEMEQTTLLDAILSLVITLSRIVVGRRLLQECDLEYKILARLLFLINCVDPALKQRVEEAITVYAFSVVQSSNGEPTQLLLSRHFGRVMLDKDVASTPCVRLLVIHSGQSLADHIIVLLSWFQTRLQTSEGADFDYITNATDNISAFTLLNQFLSVSSAHGVPFTDEQVERLLRLILPHTDWHRGRTSVEFRRIAIACTCVLVSKYRPIVQSMPAPLIEDLCQRCTICLDADDPAIRNFSTQLSAVVLFIPLLTSDQRAAILSALLKRLDDNQDDTRVKAVKSIGMAYANGGALEWGHKFHDEAVTKLLLHMDDHEVVVKEACCNTLLCIAGAGSDFRAAVQRIAREVGGKHRTSFYIDKLLA